MKNSHIKSCTQGEKGNLLHYMCICKLVQPLWRTVWRFLKKLKIELPYDPAIPLLGVYPEKSMIWKDTCTLIFIAALLTIAKMWKQHKCPSTEEWIKKMWYIYTMEYYSAIKKNETAICGNMDECRDCHSPWSINKSDREGEIYGIPYMWNLKKWYKLTHKIENETMTAKGEG